MACVYCNLDMHVMCSECEEGECCCGGIGFVDTIDKLMAKSSVGGKPTGAKKKPGEFMRDVLSTGRHRAANKIPESALGGVNICGWSELLFAGGGCHPIVGCNKNTATDRHHGPDKSVLQNDDDLETWGFNLHAICAWCHNRWHAANDKTYSEPRPAHGASWVPTLPYKEHDANSKASPRIIELHEAWWKLPIEARALVNGGIFLRPELGDSDGQVQVRQELQVPEVRD